ncbi:unnamed protein product [Acanthoscelides obtectus]|uniref:Uncharacterized protein n=1 Tax=Acanthoscelides obtectus TaxID=200917 RepID=A0A9P0JHJ0_ACAOB|nr:unnamed protein product [Acanthoscelides obtectus]CAK1639791.1 hypothetical protein AOBTE_LOCUS11377 [Acanthoscelides obtectus]
MYYYIYVNVHFTVNYCIICWGNCTKIQRNIVNSKKYLENHF